MLTVLSTLGIILLTHGPKIRIEPNFWTASSSAPVEYATVLVFEYNIYLFNMYRVPFTVHPTTMIVNFYYWPHIYVQFQG